MKKFVFLMTFLVTGFLFTKNVLASDYSTIKDISKQDSVMSGTGDQLDVVITNNGTKDVLVEYGKNSGIKLKYLDSSKEGRPDNAAWLGINVPAPTSASQATYTVNGTSQGNVEADGNYYFGITEEKLNAAAEKNELITYTYVFTWKEGVKQTITIKIHPESITLQDKTGNTIWTEEDAKKNDDAPKTGSTIPVLLIGAIIVAIISGIFSFKLKNQ